jgi:DNA-binding IclR family transcriptional regulator
MADENATRGAQTVDRAVRILEVFRADRPSLAAGEIAEAVKLTAPTTHRLLRALQNHGLVVLDSETRRYSLGSGVLRLASIILNRDDVVEITQPGLQRLRDLTGETVALHWRVNDHRVCLLEYVSNEPIRMASGLGNAYPLVAGAAGKAILAFLSAEDAERVIVAAEKGGARVDREALRTNLGQVRESGYATSVSETVRGASAIAAPLLNSGGEAIAALNITGPADRLTPAHMLDALPHLLSVSGGIMEQLGHSAPAGALKR